MADIALVVCVHFKTWNKALKCAGLEINKINKISDEEYFLNLEEVWMRLGRQPKYGEMVKPFSRYPSGTYEKHFGTWRKALEAFIKYINNEEQQLLQEEKQIFEKPLNGLSEEIKISKHKTKRYINWRLRFLVMRKDNFKCVACGRNPATDPKIILHVDHIHAWEDGGETVFENLQTLCSVCNIGKSNLDMYEK
jgi:hypothetical protein